MSLLSYILGYLQQCWKYSEVKLFCFSYVLKKRGKYIQGKCVLNTGLSFIHKEENAGFCGNKDRTRISYMDSYKFYFIKN